MATRPRRTGRKKRSRETAAAPTASAPSTPRSGAGIAAATPVATTATEVPVFPVPEPMRRTGEKRALDEHVYMLSLVDIFAEAPKLADLFDENATFRTALRTAARDDLFVPDPKLSAEANACLSASFSSLEGNWRRPNPCPAMTAVFAEHNLALDGATFLTRLGELCVSPNRVRELAGVATVEAEFDPEFAATGSWLDIVNPTRRNDPHAWHQDSGSDQQWTCMLGFPPSSEYTGPGVFSHCVKLSHRLEPPEEPGPVIIPDALPEPFVLRPVYSKGREVMIYRDSHLIHSAPDAIIRESLWRFM